MRGPQFWKTNPRSPSVCMAGRGHTRHPPKYCIRKYQIMFFSVHWKILQTPTPEKQPGISQGFCTPKQPIKPYQDPFRALKACPWRSFAEVALPSVYPVLSFSTEASVQGSDQRGGEIFTFKIQGWTEAQTSVASIFEGYPAAESSGEKKDRTYCKHQVRENAFSETYCSGEFGFQNSPKLIENLLQTY